MLPVVKRLEILPSLRETTSALEEPPSSDADVQRLSNQRVVTTRLVSFQPAFVRAKPKPGKKLHILVSGGRGSAKSRGGAIKVMSYMFEYPGSVGCVVAPTMAIAKAATLQSIRDTFRDAGFVEGKDFDFVNNRDEFMLTNGSKFFLRSTEEAEHLRGLNLAWFWMDEARDSPYSAYYNLALSLRQQGFPHMGWITTTPSGKGHWLYRAVAPDGVNTPGVLAVDGSDELEVLCLDAPTRANPYGGEELYQSCIGLFGGAESPLAQQELLGKWVRMERLVFPSFNADRLIVPGAMWPKHGVLRTIAGVDFGWSAPAAIIVEGYEPISNKAGRRFLLDELYGPNLTEGDLAGACKSFMRRYAVQRFPCDSAEPRLIHALRQEGIPAYGIKKHNTIAFKIAACTAAINDVDSDGKQTFYASPNMQNWRQEMENFTRKQDKEGLNPSEKPLDASNHAIDAWGYAELEILRLFEGADMRKLSILENIRIG